MYHDCVEILLATYNGAKFLREQLDSLLNQTHQSIHIYIGDDDSTDATPSIIQEYLDKYPAKLTLAASSGRHGVIGNFSRLMKEAKGAYVMFCDQDDVWAKDKIEVTLKQMKAAEREHGAATPVLVHTDLQVVDTSLQVIAPSYWRYAHLWPNKASSLNRLLAQNVVTGCTVMINRALLELAYPVPNQVFMHDWWLALVAAAFGKVIAINQATILYRQHHANTLGAQKFFTVNQVLQWKNIKLKLESRKHIRARQSVQADELLSRFSLTLPSPNKEMISAFKISLEAPALKRVGIIVRYRLYKNGWIRNIVNFLT